MAWPHAAGAVAGLVVEALLAWFQLGLTGLYLLCGGTVAVVAVCLFMARRCTTDVGAAGITVGWGFGAGRTYAWHDIRQLYVWQGTGAQAGGRTARMILADGRHRSLPALATSSVYPDADFDGDFHRVVRWWEASTDPADRFPPPPTLRQRISPQWWGVILALVVSAGLFVGVVVANA
ncbi:PH domain-containing protein [Streptomyces sp. NPDC004031]